jgi:hypothetical protein
MKGKLIEFSGDLKKVNLKHKYIRQNMYLTKQSTKKRRYNYVQLFHANS